MADVQPLRGVRFDRRVSGPVGPLIAPPYDVAAQPLDGAELSIGGVEYVNLGVPGDQHEFAAHRYGVWRRNGVLIQDNTPAIYLHQHTFEIDGAIRARSGLMACVRLADWADRIVLPHERTTPGPRAERLARLRAVGANLSPLYFLYRDPNREIRDLLTRSAATDMTAERDRMGGAHVLQPLSDPKVMARLATLFASRTLFVADGHHRYEAALAYRDEQRQQNGAAGDAPWEFVLALLTAVEDPGVFVRATHRVLVGGVPATAASILELLRGWFAVSPATSSLPAADEAGFIGRIVLPPQFGSWDIRSLPGNPHLTLLPRDRGAAWKSLGVVALDAVLGSWPGLAESGTRINYVVGDREAIEQVDAGQACAALLFPAPNLDRLLAVAEEGDLLPPKSTWFEPKAPAGLVINELRSPSKE